MPDRSASTPSPRPIWNTDSNAGTVNLNCFAAVANADRRTVRIARPSPTIGLLGGTLSPLHPQPTQDTIVWFPLGGNPRHGVRRAEGRISVVGRRVFGLSSLRRHRETLSWKGDFGRARSRDEGG
jgi:hypothetical protein